MLEKIRRLVTRAHLFDTEPPPPSVRELTAERTKHRESERLQSFIDMRREECASSIRRRKNRKEKEL